jgi:cyclopropane fatty-acyl-phospholipid synthase-like methyltransferase
VNCCGSGFCRATDRQFNARRVGQEVERYRRKGPDVTTRLLRDGLTTAGPLTGSLLDVGCGIGALTFELLNHGIERAVAVDASEAYVKAARDEANRRGGSESIEWRHADFVSRAGEFQTATVVAMDRVVCCYPAYEPILSAAVNRAERWFALSYPRDRWYVRAATALENSGRALIRNPFRTFVHPVAEMERLIRDAGFRLVHRSGTAIWRVDVYVTDRP